MKGRWAAGIVPRNFAWIVQDRLAVSERPGGYAPHHRRVRRQEEILWLESQGFTRVVSLLPSSHNLHAYEELGLPSAHFGLPPQADVRETLAELYPAMLGWLRDGERLLLHQEELGERVAGVVAGFLCWCGVIPDPPRAIYAVEQLLRRQMGSSGRAIVTLTSQIPPPDRPATRLHDGPMHDDVAHGGPERGGPERGGPERDGMAAAEDVAAPQAPRDAAPQPRPEAGVAKRPSSSTAPKRVAAPASPRGAVPAQAAKAPAAKRATSQAPARQTPTKTKPAKTPAPAPAKSPAAAKATRAATGTRKRSS